MLPSPYSRKKKFRKLGLKRYLAWISNELNIDLLSLVDEDVRTRNELDAMIVSKIDSVEVEVEVEKPTVIDLTILPEPDLVQLKVPEHIEKIEIETPTWVEAVEDIEGVSYDENFEENDEDTMEIIDEEHLKILQEVDDEKPAWVDLEGDAYVAHIREIEEQIEEEIEEIVLNKEQPFFIEKINYSSMTVRELQSYCRKRGVKISGTKAEVVMRLNRHDDGIMEDTANSEPEAPSEEAAEETLDAPVEETAVTDGEINEYSEQRRIIDEEE